MNATKRLKRAHSESEDEGLTRQADVTAQCGGGGGAGTGGDRDNGVRGGSSVGQDGRGAARYETKGSVREDVSVDDVQKKKKMSWERAVGEGMRAEAERERKQGKKRAYLSGIDWERMGHGKMVGPGTVTLAYGVCDAILKIRQPYIDVVDGAPEEEDEWHLPATTSMRRTELVALTVEEIKSETLQSDFGLREWAYNETPDE